MDYVYLAGYGGAVMLQAGLGKLGFGAYSEKTLEANRDALEFKYNTFPDQLVKKIYTKYLDSL
jgi:hypothetical protein